MTNFILTLPSAWERSAGFANSSAPKRLLDLYQENRRVSDLDQTKQDILMVGVGGQGIILASDILGEAALEKGLDIKKTDTLGMAQRGGSVTSHLRIGQKVWSPLTSPAEADILLAFEKLEAARWVNYLKPGGLAIINNLAIPPLSIFLSSVYRWIRCPGEKRSSAIGFTEPPFVP